MPCSWASPVGRSSLTQLCPKLTHLTLAHCQLINFFFPSMGCSGLQHLNLHRSSSRGVPVEMVPFLSRQLKSVDVSATSIADDELRKIVGSPVAVG